MISINFIPWGKFTAFRNYKVTDRWLRRIRAKSQEAFARGMLGPHTGIKHPFLPNRSSAPGEYPANQSGGLLRSMKTYQRRDEVGIGTNVFYAKFLREGTSRIKRRKMSDNALIEGREASKGHAKGWVAWQKSRRSR